MASPGTGFEVVWEIDPPVQPDLRSLHDQIEAVRDTATSVLVPDNHTGRATVSSIAVARRVRHNGMHAIACLNARDRNLLGLRRDLLTCTVEGVDDVLLVYGDQPDIGSRSSDVTVRTMVDECRASPGPLRVGVTTRLRPVPTWKLEADRLFVQISYDLDALLRWRDATRFDGPVYPAVMVVNSVSMAARLAKRVPELQVPARWLAAVAGDPNAGVRLAAELVEAIRESAAFEGVHLVSGRRYRDTAARLRRPAAASARPLVPASN